MWKFWTSSQLLLRMNRRLFCKSIISEPKIVTKLSRKRFVLCPVIWRKGVELFCLLIELFRLSIELFRLSRALFCILIAPFCLLKVQLCFLFALFRLSNTLICLLYGLLRLISFLFNSSGSNYVIFSFHLEMLTKIRNE